MKCPLCETKGFTGIENLNLELVNKQTARALLAAAKKASRIMSHIQDAHLADFLKYIPISAYKEGYAQLKTAVFMYEREQQELAGGRDD